MENIINSNIVSISDVVPWYYLTQSILDDKYYYVFYNICDSDYREYSYRYI